MLRAAWKVRASLPLRRQPVALAIGAGLDGAPNIGGDGADAPAGFSDPAGMASQVEALFRQGFASFWTGPLWTQIKKLVYIGFRTMH